MKQQIVFLCILLVVGTKAGEIKLNPFIINGTTATGSPSYVHVQYVNAQNLGFFGGGEIISLTHILTAAHIIVGFVSWNVGFGSSNVLTMTRSTSTVALAHPNFAAANRVNDIGIITLPIALTLSPTIQPIALPQLDQVLPFEFEQGRIYGFGFATIVGGQQQQFLQLSYQRVTTHAACLAAHPSAVQAQQFCTQDLVRQSNICAGDLGGGFIIPYRGVDVLVGIATFTIDQCNTITPARYVRVSNYRAWIRQVTGV